MTPVRVLFVNSGILGHRAVARVLEDAVGRLPDLCAEQIDLAQRLTISDRLVRRLLSVQLAPSTGMVANLDLRRWRQELNVGWLAARRIRALERISPERGFDVLHFHPQATAYTSLARMSRTPSVVSIDATQHLAMEAATSRLGRVSYRPSLAHDGAVFRAARAIVATSAWAARWLADEYPECAGKVHVMPYPIDSSRFEAAWIEERAAQAVRVPPTPVRALFVGGDFLRKGGPDLLGAWRSGGLAAHATLDLVTDWPLRPLELPPGVRLVGSVAPYSREWYELWRRADLFVMPTRQEAFGMVYQEAAAAGLPVIATNINAIPEIVQDTVTGLLVRPGDQDQLIGALRTLVKSAELRRQMGTAGRRRITSISDPAAYATKLGDLIRSAVSTQGAPRAAGL